MGVDRRTMTLGVLATIGATTASSLAAGYLALSSGDGGDAETGGDDDAGTGDTDDPPGPTPTPVPDCGVAPGAGAWRSYGGDAGNTGRAPASAAPSGRVDRCWTVTADAGDGRWSRPAVVDGTVYAVDPGGTVPNRVAVGNQRVYVPTDGDRLYALSTDAGRTVWRYNRLDGGASAPVVADDAVYVRSEEAIHAVDADDGTRRWRAEVRGGLHSPPVVAGGGVYLAGEDALVALS